MKGYQMGTRSLTFIKDENDNIFTCFYKQYDGYPDGYGKELVDFLKTGKLVNGIPYRENDNTLYFNGMACLAAQIVAHFKDGAGGYYIYSPTIKDAGQNYTYTIYSKGKNLFVKVEGYKNKILFDGNIEDFSSDKCSEID